MCACPSANAGTHTPRLLVLKKLLDDLCAIANNCGYGSRLKAGTTDEIDCRLTIKPSNSPPQSTIKSFAPVLVDDR
jgi:hypothetical protein